MKNARVLLVIALIIALACAVESTQARVPIHNFFVWVFTVVGETLRSLLEARPL